MQVSSSNLITVRNELGTSGKFLELARNGRLIAVSEGMQYRAAITKELAEVEGTPAQLQRSGDGWRNLQPGAERETYFSVQNSASML